MIFNRFICMRRHGMSKYLRIMLIILSGLGLTALFVVVLPAQGRLLASPEAAIIVNTLEDEDNSDGDCSLREAIRAANDNIPVDACPAGDEVITDTITFSVNGKIILDETLGVYRGGPLLIDGAGAITISGNDSVPIFDITSGAEVTLESLVLVDGLGIEGAIGGGAIVNWGNLTISNCTLSNNSSFVAGGILNEGSLTIINSTLSGNRATSLQNGVGGAILNSGTTSIANSTLSGNTATRSGGGISNYMTLIVTNSTISGNSATAEESYGGGLANWDGEFTIANSTLSGNSAGVYGGAIFNIGYSQELSNSIVANSPSGGNCAGDEIIDAGHNLEDSDTCWFDPANGSMPNTDPLLGPLQDNGGPTWTHALQYGSPAIDHGDPVNCPATDQRGMPRPMDGDDDGVATCDIGAFEHVSYLTVNTLDDEDNGDGDCSLHEAIHAANNNATVDECIVEGGKVDFIQFSVDGTIMLNEQLMVTATGPLLIDGADAITISGDDSVRLFYVDTGADLILKNIDLVDGNAGNADGGGIYNLGTLTLINSNLSGNRNADYSGGGIYNEGDLTVSHSNLTENSSYCGGAIANLGTTQIMSNTVVSGNMGSWGGSICGSGDLIISESTLSGNQALYGGAISNAGRLEIMDSMLSDNSASQYAGVINNIGTVTLSNTVLLSNTAGVNGGVIFNGSLVEIAEADRLAELPEIFRAGMDATHTMTITNGLFAKNSAENGGSIYNGPEGYLTITSSSLTENSAHTGGAIYNLGTLTVAKCIVSTSSATNGSGFYNDGILGINNSTLSGNTASEYGGGIYNTDVLTITYSTLAENGADLEGGALYNSAGFTGVELNSSIIAKSTSGGNCAGEAITDAGYNLEDTDSCGFIQGSSMPNTNPLLSVLRLDWGRTQVHSLLPGSPAIDHGDTLTCPATDQRGLTRPYDGDDDGIALCDIGSYEYVILYKMYMPLIPK